MSRYLEFFIEYRKDSKSDWKLLETFTKIKDKEYTSHHFSNSDIEILSGDTYKKNNIISFQGDIRDEIDSNSFPFSSRGFPKDLSSEIESIIKMEPDNYMYGKSYFILSEYEMWVEKELQKRLNNLIDFKISKISQSINERLDLLENFIRDLSGLKRLKVEDNDGVEVYNGELEELKDNYHITLALYSLCSSISFLVENTTGHYYIDYDNIRIIYYISC